MHIHKHAVRHSRYGRDVLRGRAAWDYISAEPVTNHELCELGCT